MATSEIVYRVHFMSAERQGKQWNQNVIKIDLL